VHKREVEPPRARQVSTPSVQTARLERTDLIRSQDRARAELRLKRAETAFVVSTGRKQLPSDPIGPLRMK
jgi:hypothetical protein